MQRGVKETKIPDPTQIEQVFIAGNDIVCLLLNRKIENGLIVRIAWELQIGSDHRYKTSFLIQPL